MGVSAEDRQEIRAAYNYCCGYCGISETDVGGELQIDHYHPVAKGGEDNLDNLVYACVHCNLFKGDYWPGIADLDSFHILHPVKDDLSAHLKVIMVNGRLEGLTPRGWFYIHRLQLNRPQLIIWRQKRQGISELVAALRHSQEINAELQRRIYELEREASLLRERIARLSGFE